MTQSQDIIYRLGRLEAGQEYLKSSIDQLNGKLDQQHAETKLELRELEVRIDRKLDQLHAEVQQVSSVASEARDLGLQNDARFNMFLWFIGFCVAVIAVCIAWRTFWDARKQQKPEPEHRPSPQQQSEHTFSLSLDAIKSLIDYYKTGK